MAIEDYTGVTKIDDYLYEVTGEVTLDAQGDWTAHTNGETFAIGTVENATFIMKNGGFLRFATSDAATDSDPFTIFRGCTFIETSTCMSLPGDRSFRGPGYSTDTMSDAARFYKPGRFRFEGCTWIVDNDHTFQQTTGGTHRFQYVKNPNDGTFCRFYMSDDVVSGGTHNLYINAEEDTFDGVHFDVSGAVSFNGSPYRVISTSPFVTEPEPERLKDIIVADKANGDLSQDNINFIISTWSPFDDQGELFFYYLKGRAVSCAQTPYYHWIWDTSTTQGQTVFSGAADTVYGSPYSELVSPTNAYYITNNVLNSVTQPLNSYYETEYGLTTGQWRHELRKNGVLLEEGTDYTLTNNSSFTLAVGANAGDEIHFRADARFMAELRSVNLVDPIGRLMRTTVSDYHSDHGGILRLWRTYAGSFVDISTKQAIASVRTVITKDSDSSLHLDETGASFSKPLMYLEQPMEINTYTEDGDYTAKFLSYGYDFQERGVTIGDTEDINGFNVGSILLFQDGNVTERNEATVDAYTELLTTPQIYDYFKHWEMTRPTTEVGNPFVTINAAGDTLDFGDKDVYFGDFAGNMVTYFDSNYITPQGSSVGETSFTGYNMVSTTAITSDTIFNFASSAFPSYGTWGNLILKNIDVSPDGTKMLMAFNSSSDGGTYIAQFTMSTAFDLTTASRDNIVKLANSANQYYHVTIDHGKYVTVASDSSSAWFFYEFATAYDISSTRTDTSGSGVWGAYNAYNFAWSYDGTRLYKFQNNSSLVYRYAVCSTPWNLSTAGGLSYEPTSNSDLSGEHTTSVGGSQYQRWQGISMRWIDDNTVFLASGSTGKYTIITTATSNLVTVSEINNATMLDIPSTGEIGWATISGQEIYSFDPAAAGATSLNYTLDHCQASGSVDLVGAPNSLLIQANSAITDGSSAFTTLKTSGYFYELNSASINTATQDATGIGTTVTIKGINPNTEVRMYRVSDDTEIAGVENSTGTQTSLAYNFVAPEDTYIIIHNTAYVTSPSRIEFTTQAAAATLTVFQQLDRAYSNP